MNSEYKQYYGILKEHKVLDKRNKYKDLTFIRYGGLSSVPQLGYSSEPESFHQPPAKRGVYAFVWPYIERFLLGGEYGNKKIYVKDKNGNIIISGHPEFEKYYNGDRNKYFTVKYKQKPNTSGDDWDDWIHAVVTYIKPKKFKYDGDIWSHLDIPEKYVISRHGDWVKSSYESYTETFQKELHKMKRGNAYRSDQASLPNNPTKYWAKDHLEVFIEKI
jgi:hypothetical protein